MELTLMFFDGRLPTADASADGPYRLVLDAARLADRLGFRAVWTPERHFHAFGGSFPNPALLSAALAVSTTRIQIRAGSVISPLHRPIRLVEDWSVVDHLSGGRVGISFGAGWNRRDFVLRPEAFDDRASQVFRDVEAVAELWRTGIVTDGSDQAGPVVLAPRPIQPELPTWVTSSGRAETMVRAGSIGANLLTHALFQDPDALVEHVAGYRRARMAARPTGGGIVTLMLHTYVGSDDQDARLIAGPALEGYLGAAISLEREAGAAGGTISGGLALPAGPIDDDLLEELAELAALRLMDGSSLVGSVETCHQRIATWEERGIDEIACLVDFGVAPDLVLAGIERLAELL